MKQIKRNKSKVWRKCYGKPFIARKAMAISQMAVVAAQGQAQLSAMIGYGVPAGVVLAQKALAVANSTTNAVKAITSAVHEMNKGFCK